MNRLFTIMGVAALTLTLIIWQSFSKQGQLYSNSGGAPDPENCNACHSSAALNNPSGSISLSIAGNPTAYTPNQTYDITVTQTFSGRNRFGFGFSAKQVSNGSLKGTPMANGNNDLQVFSGYATHTAQGASASNSKTWTFKWKAPATNVGTISLNAWGNAANNDGSSNGDFIYKTSKQLSFSTGVEAMDAANMKVFPVPASNLLHVQLNATNGQPVAATLTGMNGNSISLSENEAAVTNGLSHYTIPATLARGMYLLHVQSGDAQYTKKILIN